jgi:hypothetical protein
MQKRYTAVTCPLCRGRYERTGVGQRRRAVWVIVELLLPPQLPQRTMAWLPDFLRPAIRCALREEISSSPLDLGGASASLRQDDCWGRKMIAGGAVTGRTAIRVGLSSRHNAPGDQRTVIRVPRTPGNHGRR